MRKFAKLYTDRYNILYLQEPTYQLRLSFYEEGLDDLFGLLWKSCGEDVGCVRESFDRTLSIWDASDHLYPGKSGAVIADSLDIPDRG